MKCNFYILKPNTVLHLGVLMIAAKLQSLLPLEVLFAERSSLAGHQNMFQEGQKSWTAAWLTPFPIRPDLMSGLQVRRWPSKALYSASLFFFFLALCSQDTKLHVSSKHFGSFSLRFVSKHLFVQLWGVIGAFAWWYHTTVSWKDDSKSLTLGA